MTDLERVERCWDQTAQLRASHGPLGWLDSPLVLGPYVLPAIAGSETTTGNWVSDVAKALRLPRDGRWLSLGCGEGGQELLCVRQGLCRRLDAYDISSESIDSARRKAAEEGLDAIHFEVADFHELALGRRRYDVVVMGMSLHHVAELNKLLPAINRAITKDGYLLVNEYIGPAQFQYPDRQIEIVERLLAALPARLRLDSLTGETRTTYKRRSRKHWFHVDPSESISSDRIEGALHRYFDVALDRKYGGPILNLLLENIIANFDGEDEGDVAILRLLMAVERLLIDEGVVEHQFAVFACRPRWTPALWASRFYRLADALRIAGWQLSAGILPFRNKE